MKKAIILLVTAMMAVSCSTSFKYVSSVITSATHSKSNAVQPVAALYADLDVSETKITFAYIPVKTVLNGGHDNVINTAVREALAANGDGDVLVAMETRVKYNAAGDIESVIVSGYPARYTNFRNADDAVLSKIVESNTESANQDSSSRGFSFGLK